MVVLPYSEGIRALRRGRRPYSQNPDPCPFLQVKGEWLFIDYRLCAMIDNPELATRELLCNGTPALVATAMLSFSNELARESGGSIFAFADHDFGEQPPLGHAFDPDAILIKGIWVWPSGRYERSDDSLHMGLGRINLQAIAPDEDGPRTRLHFECRREEWPLFEERWAELEQELRRLGFTDGKDGNDVGETRPPGRRRHASNLWAYEQVKVDGRRPSEILDEWLEKREDEGRYQPEDPLASLRKAISDIRKSKG